MTDDEDEVCVDETCTDEAHAHGHAAAAASGESESESGGGHGHGGGGHGHGGGAAAAGEKEGGHGHGHGAKIKAKKKIHDLSRVGSVGIKLEGNLDNIKVMKETPLMLISVLSADSFHDEFCSQCCGVCQFNYFMGTLLRERQADLYRSKGVLSIEGQGDTKFVFQVTPAHPPPPPDWLRPDSTPFKGVTALTKA